MMNFINPVIPGFNPAPSVCRVNEDFFLVTSSFEFFPAVPLYHSWNLVNYCLSNTSQANIADEPPDGGIWAPTIRYHVGKFYVITYNQKLLRQLYITSEDPFGKCSGPCLIDLDRIDPPLFFDEDGKVYLHYAGGQKGIYQCQIDIDTGSLITQPQLTWKGTGGRCPEGPHLYKINATYFLMIAEGETGQDHIVTIAKANSPMGPFEPSPFNPILTHRDRWGHDIQCTGHADMIEIQNGTLFAVFLTPVIFKNGRPIIYETETVETEIRFDSIKTLPKHQNIIKTEFKEKQPPIFFNSLRKPIEDYCSFDERKDHLMLYSQNIDLDKFGTPSMLITRLTAHKTQTTSGLDFNPIDENDHASLPLFCNNKFHTEIYITLRQGKPVSRFSKTIGDAKENVKFETVNDIRNIHLRILTSGQRCEFHYATGGDKFYKLGNCASYCPAWAITFTGLFAGIYSVSKNNPGRVFADFDWFEYKTIESSKNRRE